MRVTPSHEQMAYLASIGVSNATITHQPGPAFTRSRRRNRTGRRSAARRTARVSRSTSERYTFTQVRHTPTFEWWQIVLFILAMVLSMISLAGPAHGQGAEGPLSRGVISGGDDTPRFGLENAGADVQPLAEGNCCERLPPPIARPAEFQTVDAETERSGLASGALKADASLIEAARQRELQIDSQLSRLRTDIERQRQDFARVLFLLATLIVLIVGLTITQRILMERRIRQVEQEARLQEREGAVMPGSGQSASTGTSIESAAAATDARKAAPGSKVQVEAQRPQEQSIPTPVEEVRRMIALIRKSPTIRVKPELSSGPWKLALATDKGNVRQENQDFGLCFETGGHDVLIVADGCGGLPHGRIASYLAAVSAALSVMRTYGTAPRWRGPHVTDAAAKAIADAAHRLAIEGDKLNVTDVRGGLRTTLIVVVGNRREVGYAYIGDGGGCVVRASGEVRTFLEPQKASDLGMNVLAASLGPRIEGEPVTGTLTREPGDLLIVGTDGIFDRVDNGFPKDVLRGCIQYKGDLQKAAEQIVQELAACQDSGGYICDDNLTLGMMGDGTNPKLPSGFWLSEGTVPAAPVGVSPAKARACPNEGA